MVVKDILDTYKGLVRVHNDYDDLDVGIIDTSYKGWVKMSYQFATVTKLELEMLNTAVLSARLVIFINDSQAGGDSGDVEEASAQDIQELMDSIYKDDGTEPTEKETIEVITVDYYDHQPLPGDENDFKPTEEPTSQEEPAPEVPPVEVTDTEEDTEATTEDIQDLLNGIYD